MENIAFNIPMTEMSTIRLSKKVPVKTVLLLGLVMATCCAASRAQPSPDSLDLWLDYACFRMTSAAPESLTRVEIYYGLNHKELSSKSSDSLQELTMQLELYSSADSLVGKDNWKVAYRAGAVDTQSIGDFFSDIYLTRLAPGEYRAKLSCQDQASARSGSHTLFLKVPRLTSSELELSGLELALEVRESSEQNRFVKNSRLVWPNPTTVYGSLNPLLFFYAEAYNLNSKAADSFYLVSYAVLDSSGKVFKEYGQYQKIKPGNSAVIATGLNIASLPMGEYQLQLTVSDPGRNQTARSQKAFFVYREDELAKTSGQTAEPANEEEALTIRGLLSYIATPSDLRTYDKLTLEGKRNFLKEFWQSRDTDPGTPVNEYKREISRRYAYASLHFASGRLSGSQKGWKSDRGRIYITYGPPDELKSYPYSTNQKPWEKWVYYNLQGGGLFIFEDQDGYGNYELVHSTAKGEKRSPAWESFLQREPSISRE